MYKIYINDLPFIITVPENSHFFNGAAIISPFIHNPKILISYIDLLEKQSQNYGDIVLTTSEPDEAFESFTSLFTVIEAAGGVVRNDESELLFIHRNGKWDLPKGKIEEGESPEVASVREIKEETGVDSRINNLLCITYHSYKIDKERFLKKTYWYNMQLAGESRSLIPQQEEGIEIVKWMSGDTFLNKYRDNTYKSIIEVLSYI